MPILASISFISFIYNFRLTNLPFYIYGLVIMFLTWVDGKNIQTASEKLQFFIILSNVNLIFNLQGEHNVIPTLQTFITRQLLYVE
jgi:hypothetical protein